MEPFARRRSDCKATRCERRPKRQVRSCCRRRIEAKRRRQLTRQQVASKFSGQETREGRGHTHTHTSFSVPSNAKRMARQRVAAPQLAPPPSEQKTARAQRLSLWLAINLLIGAACYLNYRLQLKHRYLYRTLNVSRSGLRCEYVTRRKSGHATKLALFVV